MGRLPGVNSRLNARGTYTCIEPTMTHFEVLHENQSLPSGFDSYSLLLVPDESWPIRMGTEKMFELASRFKAFGDALGSAHLASWPYHGFQLGHSKMMDYEVCSLVFSFTGSEVDLQDFIAKQSCHQVAKEELGGGYHLERARQLCALYDLSFNKGPYVAFFSKNPHVPTVWSRHDAWKDPKEPDAPSQPDFVLQFGGRSYEDAIHLLNSFEFELLRGRQTFTSLSLLQIRLTLVEICRRLVSGMKTSLEIVKLGKDILG
jgi:hypothetical protein